MKNGMSDDEKKMIAEMLNSEHVNDVSLRVRYHKQSLFPVAVNPMFPCEHVEFGDYLQAMFTGMYMFAKSFNISLETVVSILTEFDKTLNEKSKDIRVEQMTASDAQYYQTGAGTTEQEPTETNIHPINKSKMVH